MASFTSTLASLCLSLIYWITLVRERGGAVWGEREGVEGKEEQLRIFVLFFFKVRWFMTEYVRSRHILLLDHQNLLNYLVSVLIFPSDDGL